MPITSANLDYYKSAQTLSDGGAITSTVITTNVLNNLFADVATAEAAAGANQYRKCFIKNGHATLSWQNATLWRSQNTLSSDDEVSMGMGSALDTDGSNLLTAWSGNSVVAIISNGADTRQVTIVGEDNSGVRATETLTANNAVEVVGSQSFSKVYLVYVTSLDSNRTITIKQGSGGTSRGTIAGTFYSAILYQNPTAKASGGILLGNIAAGSAAAIWLKRVVAAGAQSYTSNTGEITVEGETS